MLLTLKYGDSSVNEDKERLKGIQEIQNITDKATEQLVFKVRIDGSHKVQTNLNKPGLLRLQYTV